MSYIIEQKIKGRIYLYEVESYWDPQKKQARQRRKYLGKKDPETQEVVTPRKLPTVSSCSEFGALYLLKTLSDSIGLTEVVHKAFGSHIAKELLSLSLFTVLEGKALYLYDTWSKDLPGMPHLTSQSISSLLTSTLD
jgi:hypothetical protein